jgi:hypothetical protein
MEGAGEDLRLGTQHEAETMAQLPACPLGEGESGGGLGQRPSFSEEKGRATGQHQRLARAGAGQHQEVVIGGDDRLPLARMEDREVQGQSLTSFLRSGSRDG